MELLSNLNTAQKEAVSAPDGPTLVLAGPGSGKTNVLTRRIAYLIYEQCIRPYQILAVTFTNKAAKEMVSRIDRLLGSAMSAGLVVGTFHSFCVRVLRMETEHLQVDRNFVIYDADDQMVLIRQIIKNLNLDEKIFRPYNIHALISKAKNDLVLPETFVANDDKSRTIKKIFERYQQELISSNAVDFDDLLIMTTQLFQRQPQVLEKYASKFHHVLVDEFQDTNQVQYILIKLLAGVHRNLFCVGDPDQSIYRWRGADYHNVTRLQKDFNDLKIILLEQNYRSKQNILDVATAVINRNFNRVRKRLFSDLGTGEKIHLVHYSDEKEEAASIVSKISEMVSRRQSDPGDFAIMYRTNAMSRNLEDAFIHAGLPYKLVGAQRFYGRKEIKDLLSYLRLIHNRHDQVSLQRVINVPARGIGAKTLENLIETAEDHFLSPGEVILDLGQDPDSQFKPKFTGKAYNSLSEFGRLIKRWSDLAEKSTLTELFDSLIKDIDYEAYLKEDDEGGEERWENVLEFRNLVLENETSDLGEFLENIALVSDQDTIKEGNVPTLLTLHAAKGLEFKNVFIIGLDDGVLPHSRAFDEPEEMEEERRLFYVGITRAKERLFISRAFRRGTRGFFEDTNESRFLRDIPIDLTEGSFTSEQKQTQFFNSGYQRPAQKIWEVERRTPPSQSLRAATKFKAGMRVKHAVFGEGMVIDSVIMNKDEIVSVAFPNNGIKKLDAGIAKLTIIK
ncbi:MAG TPA: UvrD-helicase domain-containing protein [Anaerolineales bacterium]|nr:UvrD-helicase domain-containing protein [Anaerolineales bacterium]